MDSKNGDTSAPSTPKGFVRLVKPALADVPGVVRLGGPRRWWLLGGHAPAVSAFLGSDGRLRFDVNAITEPGADVRATGYDIQDRVIAQVGRVSQMPVAAVDVYITPKLPPVRTKDAS
jgi:uncharacterized alkaline shock family protein YloU